MRFEGTYIKLIDVRLKVNKKSAFQLLNILCGLQSHSAKHSCLYCEIITRGLEAWVEEGKLRTLESIAENAELYAANGSKDAKLYKNCVHPPLIKGPPGLPIIHFIPPPGTTTIFKLFRSKCINRNIFCRITSYVGYSQPHF